MVQIKFKYHYAYQQIDFRSASFSQTDLYCPECGKHDVWQEDERADYYVGFEYFCFDCKKVFHLPDTHDMSNNPKYIKLIEEVNRDRNPDVI